MEYITFYPVYIKLILNNSSTYVSINGDRVVIWFYLSKSCDFRRRNAQTEWKGGILNGRCVRIKHAVQDILICSPLPSPYSPIRKSVFIKQGIWHDPQFYWNRVKYLRACISKWRFLLICLFFKAGAPFLTSRIWVAPSPLGHSLLLNSVFFFHGLTFYNSHFIFLSSLICTLNCKSHTAKTVFSLQCVQVCYGLRITSGQ